MNYIIRMKYEYDRDLFYSNREVYDMHWDTNHYEQIGMVFEDNNYFVSLYLSKEIIEKAMYYCQNKEAKEYMQNHIDEWVKEGVW